MIFLLLTYWICWYHQDVHGITIDKLLLSGIQNPHDLEMYDPASGTVSYEIDILFTFAQWNDLQERNNTRSPFQHWRRKGSYANKLWPNAVIPYEIDGSFTDSEKNHVRSALSNWEKDTCVRFRAATNSDYNKVRFTPGSACKSYLGMNTDGRQYLYLNPDCRTMEGVITHELGHALGLYHEQSRPDRDQYVTINWEKIPEMMRNNFNKFSSDVINTYGVTYDYKSIMHYGATAFSPNDEYTIIPKDSQFLQVIGNRDALSFRDIKVINLMYKCGGHCALKTCPGEGFVNKNCVCMCPGNPIQPCSQGGTEPNAGGQLPAGFNPDENKGEETVCKDDNSQCPAWAAGDQCDQNPNYMHKYCRKSCGICGGSKVECKDANSQCRAWANAGECNRNPTYMKSFCKVSCGECPGSAPIPPTQSSCKDLNTNCPTWANVGYCTNIRNEVFMSRNCKRSCNLCGTFNDMFHDAPHGSSGCGDTDASCSGWAKVGECENNPGWMLPNCPKSCGQC